MVLIVEDEAPLVTLLKYNLEKEGFAVCSAADGEEALLQIAENKPDAVLLEERQRPSPRLALRHEKRERRAGDAVEHSGPEGDRLAVDLAEVVEAPEAHARTFTAEAALIEVVRGRLEGTGPTTAQALATALCLAPARIEAALAALQAEGCVMRGAFTPDAVPAARDGC